MTIIIEKSEVSVYLAFDKTLKLLPEFRWVSLAIDTPVDLTDWDYLSNSAPLPKKIRSKVPKNLVSRRPDKVNISPNSKVILSWRLPSEQAEDIFLSLQKQNLPVKISFELQFEKQVSNASVKAEHT